MTKQAYKIQAEIDKLDFEVQEQKEKIEELQKKICDYCDGTGEVLAKHKIHSRSVSPPYEDCPECAGSGVLE